MIQALVVGVRPVSDYDLSRVYRGSVGARSDSSPLQHLIWVNRQKLSYNSCLGWKEALFVF